MKKILFIFSILFIISSCSKIDIFSTNEIEGEFTDYKGKIIYVVYENFKSGIVTDTIYIDDNKFELDIELNNSKTPVYILDENFNNITAIFIKEGDAVNLSGSSKSYKTTINGDSTNILIGDFFNNNSQLIFKYDSLKLDYIKRYQDSIYIEELNRINDSIVIKATEFIESNLSSAASTFILYNYVASPKYKTLTRKLAEKLSPVAKAEVISARIEQFAAIQLLDKGKTLPYPQLKTPTDSLVYNYNYKNKITIVTFWDSSDSLSVLKIQEIDKFYDSLKNKDKVSSHLISLDIDKDSWISTINNYDLKSFTTNLQDGWTNKDISAINLRVVPSIFLLNRNGVIIGRELDLDSLNYLIDKTIINNDSIDNLRKNRGKKK